MARHRSPGGRCASPAFTPSVHAGRAPVARRHGLPSVDATTVISAVGSKSASHRAAQPKPLVRANSVVGATAALGAVVTGSFVAVDSGLPGETADVVEAAGTDAMTPLDLANASQALAMQPVGAGQPRHKSFSDFEISSAHTAMLPVSTPREHYAASDKRDVEMLHKAERLATEAAAVHAAASKEAFLLSGGGKLDDWIRLALVKMDMPQSLAPGIKKVIMKESRGNPKAINRYDSNARAGRPSQGLMQCIPTTYRAFVLPELAHLPITNPVSNITAGVRYMVKTYGLSTLLRGGRVDAAGRYLGY